jgi:bacterioferritin-associated ferredoxin
LQFRRISFHGACRHPERHGKDERLIGPTAPETHRMADPLGSAAVIVCSCNVISDHQVRTVAAEQSARATSDVYRCLGCSAECGRCARTIRRIMDEALAASKSSSCCGRT